MLEPLSPFVAIAGGLLIGVAAALLLLGNGRIAGVSGMVATACRIDTRGTPWGQATAFVVGLPLGAGLVAVFIRRPELLIGTSPAALVVAGLLVGFGTRLGNGCTSGHGVCGTARLSPRSIAATLTFMGVAAVSVFFIRHVLGV
ncbi:YeeE/YedE family protein [Pelagerythrobacter marensis]|uniref:Putative transporter component n=1 Tax=Pelagerythrobacter marensis TaxID=543877 RepID=A0A0G3X6Y0_9SPHN|nr:YeeE/YedE family protein [Pelagerythrobacter marensis]AKM06391.1 Putative transporter component [Pelagerythrobacter marensis]